MFHDPNKDPGAPEFLNDLIYEITLVQLADIVVPPYQRLAEDRAHRLAKRLPFNQNLAPPVDVLREPDGTLLSLNGAGRQWLARQSGVMTIQARVFSVKPDHPGLTTEKKQALVEWLNGGTDSYTASDKFNSRLTVGLEPEVTLAETFKQGGLPWQKKKEEGYWFSASQAYTMWEDGLKSELGAVNLILRTISVMIDGYGQLGDSNNPQVAVGVGKIFRVNGNKVDSERLADILRRAGSAKQLLESAKDVRNGNGAGVRAADHLVKLYNKKLPVGMPRLRYVTTALKKH